MINHKKIFTEIYDKNIWGGSGGGSMPEVTGPYREFLQNFLKEKNIKSVIDFGCGDWMFSHLVDWSGVYYLGVDVVNSVIENNIKKYGVPGKIEFKRTEQVSAYDIEYPRADLLIVKDVLQHWTNDHIVKFIAAYSKFKYILITNTSNQTHDNQDSENPHLDTRPLSAKFLPLKQFNPEIVLETNIYEPKETSLITNHSL